MEVLPALKLVLVSKICQAFSSHFHFHSLARWMGVMLVMVMIWVMVMLKMVMLVMVMMVMVMVMIWEMVMTNMCFHYQGAAPLKP